MLKRCILSTLRERCLSVLVLLYLTSRNFIKIRSVSSKDVQVLTGMCISLKCDPRLRENFNIFKQNNEVKVFLNISYPCRGSFARVYVPP